MKYEIKLLSCQSQRVRCRYIYTLTMNIHVEQRLEINFYGPKSALIKSLIKQTLTRQNYIFIKITYKMKRVSSNFYFSLSLYKKLKIIARRNEEEEERENVNQLLRGSTFIRCETFPTFSHLLLEIFNHE